MIEKTAQPVAVLAAAAGLAALAACSSSGGTHGSGGDAAFVTRANAICAQAVARHDGAQLPVADFDPLHPRPQDLPAVGRYFAKYGGAGWTVVRLDRLAAPNRYQAGWSKLRALLDRVAQNARRQIAAAERSDVAAFEQTVRAARSLGTQIDHVGPTVGFASSSPCRQVFG